MSPFAQDVDPGIEQARLIGLKLEHVDRFVERRVGVEVSAETNTMRFQKAWKIVVRKLLRSIKGHVLIQVSNSLLIIIFQNRTCSNYKTQFCSMFRLAILQNIIMQAIWKRTRNNLRIKRQFCTRIVHILRMHILRMKNDRENSC